MRGNAVFLLMVAIGLVSHTVAWEITVRVPQWEWNQFNVWTGFTLPVLAGHMALISACFAFMLFLQRRTSWRTHRWMRMSRPQRDVIAAMMASVLLFDAAVDSITYFRPLQSYLLGGPLLLLPFLLLSAVALRELDHLQKRLYYEQA